MVTQPKFFNISYNEYSETFSTLGDFTFVDREDSCDVVSLSAVTLLELTRALCHGFSRIKSLTPEDKRVQEDALIWSRKIGYDADYGDEVVLEIIIDNGEATLFLSRRSGSKKVKLAPEDETFLRDYLGETLFNWYFRTLQEKPKRVWQCKHHPNDPNC